MRNAHRICFFAEVKSSICQLGVNFDVTQYRSVFTYLVKKLTRKRAEKKNSHKKKKRRISMELCYLYECVLVFAFPQVDQNGIVYFCLN